MSGLTLYGIADDLLAIEDALIEAGGELTPDIEAALDAVEGAWEDKVERVVRVILNAQANVEARRAEAERLDRLAANAERTVKGLKTYLHRQMERTGKTRTETAFCKVWVQKNGRPSIQWTRDVRELPAIYRRETIEPDGTRIYEAWKAGTPLPEGFKVEHNSHLRIK
jgi:hypothetical protein